MDGREGTRSPPSSRVRGDFIIRFVGRESDTIFGYSKTQEGLDTS